jgi:uncharacterized protein YciI
MALWVRTLWVTATPEELERAREAHRRHLRELRDRGKLRLAGELGRGDGFLEVFEAEDRREAEAFARASPLVEDGLGAWTLREWRETEL